MKNYDDMTLEELSAEAGYTPLNRPRTKQEVADFFCVTPHTLDQNYSTGTGINPPSCRPPGSRRRLYLERDLLLYLLKSRDSAAA
jgi:hypothetical protein